NKRKIMSTAPRASFSDIPDLDGLTRGWQYSPYRPLRNRHAMTIVPSYLPRRYSINRLPIESRIVEVAPSQAILLHCHWQENRKDCPTIIVVHGMEGSSSSRYALGTADKAFRAGFNAIRYNMRSCGGTEHLCTTLYNASQSGDVDAVIKQLTATE